VETSCPDRASAFLQTALSDLLRAVSLHSLRPIARSSSDRVLTLYSNLPADSMSAKVCTRKLRINHRTAIFGSTDGLAAAEGSSAMGRVTEQYGLRRGYSALRGNYFVITRSAHSTRETKIVGLPNFVTPLIQVGLYNGPCPLREYPVTARLAWAVLLD
jgi:hypothetical protein